MKPQRGGRRWDGSIMTNVLKFAFSGFLRRLGGAVCVDCTLYRLAWTGDVRSMGGTAFSL